MGAIALLWPTFSFFRHLCEKVKKGPPQIIIDEIRGVLYFWGRLVCTMTRVPEREPSSSHIATKAPILRTEASFSFLRN